MSILVLGLGNLVMTDDALGCRVADILTQRFVFPEQVEVLDGGTLGLDLLPRLEGIEKLLIIDALEMDAAPGTVFRLTGNEVPRAFANKLSVHQMGLQDLLAVSELQGHLPPELVVWGAQAESIEMGTGLSKAMSLALDDIVDSVVRELAGWGAEPSSAA
ncbi:MAG TPA: HyaD/HybD family hydrogenase maturation endopeptidase [Geopsychrobacteraceae bacterium]|nr:HyaD/HybD family hydrogenase maturation endopeptidase [Geopsychrobacteraceae bacterium]